jgi:hypothetical protein
MVIFGKLFGQLRTKRQAIPAFTAIFGGFAISSQSTYPDLRKNQVFGRHRSIALRLEALGG